MDPAEERKGERNPKGGEGNGKRKSENEEEEEEKDEGRKKTASWRLKKRPEP